MTHLLRRRFHSLLNPLKKFKKKNKNRTKGQENNDRFWVKTLERMLPKYIVFNLIIVGKKYLSHAKDIKL